MENKKFCKNLPLSSEVMTDNLCELAGIANQIGEPTWERQRGYQEMKKGISMT